MENLFNPWMFSIVLVSMVTLMYMYLTNNIELTFKSKRTKFLGHRNPPSVPKKTKDSSVDYRNTFAYYRANNLTGYLLVGDHWFTDRIEIHEETIVRSPTDRGTVEFQCSESKITFLVNGQELEYGSRGAIEYKNKPDTYFRYERLQVPHKTQRERTFNYYFCKNMSGYLPLSEHRFDNELRINENVVVTDFKSEKTGHVVYFSFISDGKMYVELPSGWFTYIFREIEHTSDSAVLIFQLEAFKPNQKFETFKQGYENLDKFKINRKYIKTDRKGQIRIALDAPIASIDEDDNSLLIVHVRVAAILIQKHERDGVKSYTYEYTKGKYMVFTKDY